MTEQTNFRPYWVSPPGETVTEILEKKRITLIELAHQTGTSLERIKELLQGKMEITPDIARCLGEILGTSPTFWENREKHYRDQLNRLSGDIQWLNEIPIGDMAAFGWIENATKSNEILVNCLDFFGVSSPASWHEEYDNLIKSSTFRTSPTFESKLGAVAAWLRQGELIARSLVCKPWDGERFRNELLNLRKLTRQDDPDIFLSELERRCAECGVALIILRAPSGCRASGVTRFISKDKALLLLSCRYLSNDHFWFTFFHEAGHILLHGKRIVFVDGGGMTSDTKEEIEANEFASRTLIPEDFRPELSTLSANGRQVIRFARKISIAPGIVVGQLQHTKQIRQNQLNNLKRRFKWKEK